MMALRSREVSWWWCWYCRSAKARTAAASEHAASVHAAWHHLIPSTSVLDRNTVILVLVEMAVEKGLLLGVSEKLSLFDNVDVLTCL